jgi:hypothetical protein
VSEIVNETPTPADTPDKIYVCPACGQRYDEPTVCANDHAPTDAIEYDRATVDAADAGDPTAIATVAAQELAATSGMAGVVPAEATPPGFPAPPPFAGVTPPEVAPAPDGAPDAPADAPAGDVPAEPAPAEPAPDAPAAEPVPTAVSDALGGTVSDALAGVFAAVDELKTALGIA